VEIRRGAARNAAKKSLVVAAKAKRSATAEDGHPRRGWAFAPLNNATILKVSDNTAGKDAKTSRLRGLLRAAALGSGLDADAHDGCPLGTGLGRRFRFTLGP
jgi:hypothetical protein